MSNQTSIPQPKVVIDRVALEKIRHFVAKDSQECSGMGITRVEGDTVYVDDIQMLKQKNGAAHTDIDAEAVTKLMFDWRERAGEVNFWWHSHVNMATFWSSTDIATIRQLGEQGMCVAAVFNKRHEVRCAVAFRVQLPFSQAPQVILIDDIKLNASLDVPSELKASWDKEHEDNVQKTVYPTHFYGGRLGYGFEDAPAWSANEADYWADTDTGRREDIDWINSIWCSSRLKFLKSPKHREFEKAKGLASGTQPKLPNIATLADDDVLEKKLYATDDDDILRYNPERNVFELYGGYEIDADWYISKKKECSTLKDFDQALFYKLEGKYDGMSEQELADIYSKHDGLGDFYS